MPPPTEEQLAATIFLGIAVAPVAVAMGLAAELRPLLRYPVAAAGALVTGPWVPAACLPAFAFASLAYGGVTWPVRWLWQWASVAGALPAA